MSKNENIRDTFYVVDTRKGEGVYLTDMHYDEYGEEWMVWGTSKNILDYDIRFDNLEGAIKCRNNIINDAYTDNPEVLEIVVSVESKEVDKNAFGRNG